MDLISPEVAKQLHEIVFSQDGQKRLLKSFKHFCVHEGRCRPDIERLMTVYMNIATTTAVNQLCGNTRVPKTQIIETASALSTILRTTFAAGVLYGRARVDQAHMELMNGGAKSKVEMLEDLVQDQLMGEPKPLDQLADELNDGCDDPDEDADAEVEDDDGEELA